MLDVTLLGIHVHSNRCHCRTPRTQAHLNELSSTPVKPGVLFVKSCDGFMVPAQSGYS